jgi:alkaline phosphatase D
MKLKCLGLLIFIPFIILSQNDSITLSTIGFGSCAHQNKDQSILYKVIDKKPNLFIFLGDNIYGDTRNMNKLSEKYNILKNKAEHQALRSYCPVLATWDDHDYGKNDAGKKYKRKKQSKEIFLEFWEEPKNSSRFNHEGIYHVEYFGQGEKLTQVILLDTRTFRTRLKSTFPQYAKYKNFYKPNYNKNASILGNEQWFWLEEQLKQPATLRIIASSNQFSHEYNGYESWTNFPKEQEKMLQLISKTQAEGIIFISGDVHWGEISKLENEHTYPIYDVTSSGLTQTWFKTSKNKNRIGEAVPQNNFGLIEIDWENEQLELLLYDESNIQRVKQTVNFSSLQFD